MMLVSYILYRHFSILQTKFSDREGHEARRVELETMPLDQHIEGGHGEREPGVKRRPDPVHDLLEVAHEGQHRQDRLDEEAILPLSPLTQCEVGRIPRGGMEGGIAQDDHASVDLAHQPLKGLICNISRGTRPPHYESILVHQQRAFAPDTPPVSGETFAADLLGAAALAYGVEQ